jgi:hypothetical protein
MIVVKIEILEEGNYCDETHPDLPLQREGGDDAMM